MRDVEPLPNTPDGNGAWNDEVITTFQDNIDWDFSAIRPIKSRVETDGTRKSYEITLTYIDESDGKFKDIAIEYHKLGLWKYSNRIFNPEDFEMPEIEKYDEGTYLPM